MRRILSNAVIVAVAMILVSTAACRHVDTVVYSGFESFPSDGWDPARVLTFSPTPADTVNSSSERYDLILHVVYSPRTASAEIPIDIIQEDENGVISSDRITMRLRDIKGIPEGRKTVSVYEKTDTLRKNFVLPAGYLVELTSLSPCENTRGLIHIGLSLSRHAPGIISKFQLKK